MALTLRGPMLFRRPVFLSSFGLLAAGPRFRVLTIFAMAALGLFAVLV